MQVTRSLIQKTIVHSGSLSGIGLHTGAPCEVFFEPAGLNEGVQFFRNGKAIPLSAVHGPSSKAPNHPLRCSWIGDFDNPVLTVEHLMASLSGLGIGNIRITVEGPEIPGLDGSALPFVKFLKGLGILDQKKEQPVYRIQEPIFCSEPGRAISIYPADEFAVSYVLDYDQPYLKNQKVDFVLDPGTFEKEIAPARTFCTEKEATFLRQQGMGLGASAQNTLIIRDNGAHETQLRLDQECARHKVLDILGDLSLLGFPVLGRVLGLRSGHSLNRRLVEAIKKQRGTMTASQSKIVSKPFVMSIEDIKKVLPHRFPFLLVDRILEMDEKRIVGLKNVTGNEPFFEGHFPQKPVMPGVLMVEALAQTGGIMMLSKMENQGKLAYLVSINNARFRKTVVPGDQLYLEVTILRLKSKVGIVKGIAKVNGDEVCDAEIMFSLAD